VKLHLHEFELRLKHTFTISRESIDTQPTLIVELEQDGQRGFGEATTNPYYGVTFDSLRQAIDRVRGHLERFSLADGRPEQLWQVMAAEIADAPFALCAVDLAACDLWGKLQGKPVYELWGLDIAQIPASCYTIGIDTIETMIAKLHEMPGWPVYKIKLGTDRDVEIIRRLREQTDATFRVDANCGWTVRDALHNAEALAGLGVEFIEQPLNAENWEGHRQLFLESALPVLADESCISEEDIARCGDHFHGVNIKLVKCGGLTPARRMITAAKALGLKVMVGCMTESTVGISAIAQLLPLLDYVDMDGATLLAEDIATGVCLNNGVCHYPKRNGSGVSLLTDSREAQTH
jgi:L-alanine-DL-glutamate epimerase-like enolase superfamily enzyme